MVFKVFEALDKRFHFERARAHCDIPCGIYDPSTAQIAALTVVRMVDLMADLEAKGGEKDRAYTNSMGRYVAVKEEHAEKAKHEIRIGVAFKTAPLEFLRMIVVHELAHLKEKEHNKAFYALCQHMEQDYHQLEFDLRLYLTHLDLHGPLY